MLHKILSLKGVEILKKEQQKTLKGGYQCDYWTCLHWDQLILAPACDCDS
ncbi:hypothetical protein SAMN04487910_3905 [Aquimarina amphilecti]|uniref:Uncharacterized protein n=1 Tax=Aquimarina amphilecti TaxID=1038014 RepID=A0A1H7UVX4_AQUAM|nr:hypothetical protein [Aquimarina amphilecti]SEM01120.1 hypothetical protein SAMN04487910_3905 [Aquimarina amphilecti]